MQTHSHFNWREDPQATFAALIPGIFVIWVGILAGTGGLQTRYGQLTRGVAAQVGSAGTQLPESPLQDSLMNEPRIGFDPIW